MPTNKREKKMKKICPLERRRKETLFLSPIRKKETAGRRPNSFVLRNLQKKNNGSLRRASSLLPLLLLLLLPLLGVQQGLDQLRLPQP